MLRKELEPENYAVGDHIRIFEFYTCHLVLLG